MGPAQKKFILAATDYFFKWAEAESYVAVKDVKVFVWKNLICCFGLS